MNKKVLIILMPWASMNFPGLGPSLVYSILNQHGYAAEMLYGNLAFCNILNQDPFIFEQISKLPISEIAFSPFYFDMSEKDATDILQKNIENASSSKGGSNLNERKYYENIVFSAGRCIDYLFDNTNWSNYDIVGFSVMMQQTVASLALAKRIKKEHPNIAILFGGPSTSSPMGEEMIRAFPEIDYILQGEVDGTICSFVENYRNDQKDFGKIGGLLFRNDKNEISNGARSKPFNALDSLPVPDYVPYFSQLQKFQLSHIEPYIQIETSRGCWWGQKHHCKFCGIEDEILIYRTKSDEKVINEIIELSSRHRSLDIFPIDSIISHKSFSSLLPKLAKIREEYDYDFRFFFECKSNINTSHATTFYNAGVKSIQPGLENFSDHVLELMDKGTTGAKQIQCLKLAAERKIFVNWNFIYQNLGETEQDYKIIINLIPFILHLPPLYQEGFIPVQLNRYAPYHNTPDDFGIINIKPKSYYYDVFADSTINFDKLAFYFDFDRVNDTSPELKILYLELRQQFDFWRKHYKPEMLIQQSGPGFIKITDKRQIQYFGKNINEISSIVLEGVEAEIFSLCNEVIREDTLINSLKQKLDENSIKDFIDKMVSRYLLYRSESKQLINLPLRSSFPSQLKKLITNEKKSSDLDISLVQIF